MTDHRPRLVGRAAQTNPANRFDSMVFEEDLAELTEEDVQSRAQQAATRYIRDDSQSIVSENNSPDLNFRYSLNPYRGCAHGCSYCYARTYHEFLGFSAGLDFETKILYKPKAAALFRVWLDRKQGTCASVTLSGGTDCYQPAEKEFELTRQCLAVAIEYKQPFSIVTKNALVLRDLDLLQQLAQLQLLHVNISITSLDQELTRLMEPRTSSPRARLRAIEVLSSKGIPTRALLSPIIPGLNDIEIPNLLKASSKAGAHAAQSAMVRLPGTVQNVFFEWLRRTFPEKASVVDSRIRQIRDGELHDPRFGSRMSGTGELATQIRNTFKLFAKKYELDRELPALDTTKFRRPSDIAQLRLF